MPVLSGKKIPVLYQIESKLKESKEDGCGC